MFFNGAAGGTLVTATLNYADGMATQMAKVPDYYNDVLDTDPVIFNLAPNLAKWTMATAINEKDHHNITGVELTTMRDKMLTSIQITRADDGGTLLFWGATGVATSDVASGGAGGAAGSSGTGGGAGSGVGGAGGVAGGATGGAPIAGATSGGTDAQGGTGGAASGGSSGATITTGGTAAGGVPAASPAQTESGCGCRVPTSDANMNPWPLLMLGGCLALRRRRRSC